MKFSTPPEQTPQFPHGPWTLREYHGHGNDQVILTPEGSRSVITFRVNPEFLVPRRKAIVNLILAAPEMFAILWECVKQLSVMGETAHSKVSRRVLSKALGNGYEIPEDDSEQVERDRAIVEMAREHRLVEEGTLEVDSQPTVSEVEDNGAYVQAWLWVNFEGTSLDKTLIPGVEEETT